MRIAPLTLVLLAACGSSSPTTSSSGATASGVTASGTTGGSTSAGVASISSTGSSSAAAASSSTGSSASTSASSTGTSTSTSTATATGTTTGTSTATSTATSTTSGTTGVAACAAPTVTQADTVVEPPGSGKHVDYVALSWSGSEGALVYSVDLEGEVYLRRFDTSGHFIDSGPIALGSSAYTGDPRVSLASDGAHYVACWEANGFTYAFSCASVAVGSNTATAGLTVSSGAVPSVASGPGGFMLVYPGSTLTAQKLDGDAAAVGAAYTIGGAVTAAYVTGSPDGYGVAYEDSSTGALQAIHLDASGAPTQALYSVGANYYGGGSLGWVGVPGGWAAVWYDGTFSGGKLVSSVVGAVPHAEGAISSTAQSYGQVSAAAGQGSVAAAWSDEVGSFDYQALDATGQPLAGSSALVLHGASWDDNPNAIAGVADGFVFAGSYSAAGGTPFDTIQLVHVGCP